jgi:hydroxypyruvate reductase
VLAAGKAAAAMLAAFAGAAPARATEALRIGSADAGHPVPDERSVAAASAAVELAGRAAADDLLVVLLSGGASSLMALPAAGITLADKQQAVRALLEAGADITELNTVRKHLSGIKGGRLAAACAGTTLTLAVSDVPGNDAAVIGSGPAVGDPSTWQMALGVLEKRGGLRAYPDAVVALLERGARGEVPDTPKPGDPRLARASARVIGSAADAIEGAVSAAESLGYHVIELLEPVTGEARAAAPDYLARAMAIARRSARPCCVLSRGETTVRVTGPGRGGRNQEFALAMAGPIAALDDVVVAASVGTDGIDGPTDAAGAVVDPTTLARAAANGLPAPADVLARNDSYTFFHALGDLIVTGPTGTNVSDLQIVLAGE